jgi:2-keto-4-pentenoate hydratase/2-oxohepta-3-ene-1,7-dioic acid hydratase in catechol pathway
MEVKMRFVTFNSKGIEKIGVISKDEKSLTSLDELFPDFTMIDLIKNFSKELADKINRIQTEKNKIPLSEVVLESPIPNPPRGIICLGKNYRDHIKEVAKAIDGEDSEPDVPKFPIYFSKLVDRCIGPDGVIPAHNNFTDSLDYEVELAIIIGKEGTNIPENKVDEHIFGYTILNDVSVRNAQKKHSQWFRGKSFDGSCPMGPWIVTKEEFKYPVQLAIKSYVNGELRQDSNTKEFIFDILYIISDFSKGITLKPGDVIATGTPAGVGMGFTPPKFLKAGDEVKCYIENIGFLKNKVL